MCVKGMYVCKYSIDLFIHLVLLHSFIDSCICSFIHSFRAVYVCLYAPTSVRANYLFMPKSNILFPFTCILDVWVCVCVLVSQYVCHICVNFVKHVFVCFYGCCFRCCHMYVGLYCIESIKLQYWVVWFWFHLLVGLSLSVVWSALLTSLDLGLRLLWWCWCCCHYYVGLLVACCCF